MFPNEPLSRAPVSARVQEAVAANAFIVFDGRYDLRPFRTDLHCIDTGGLCTGGISPPVTRRAQSSYSRPGTCAFGPCDTDAMGAHARWLGSAALQNAFNSGLAPDHGARWRTLSKWPASRRTLAGGTRCCIRRYIRPSPDRPQSIGLGNNSIDRMDLERRSSTRTTCDFQALPQE